MMIPRIVVLALVMMAAMLGIARMQVHLEHSQNERTMLFAARRGNVAGLQKLLRSGANPNARVRWTDVAPAAPSWEEDAPDAFLTPLTIAAQYGQKEAVRVLLDAGAEVDAPGLHGRTALMNAVSQGDQEIVALLLSRGADVNISTLYGRTALSTARERYRPEMVQTLLRAGARR